MARILKITNANVGPLSNKGGSVGNTLVRAQDYNSLVGDYVSKTDSVAQSITGAIAITSALSLGDKAQAAGVLTSKVDTGILNHATVITSPAPLGTNGNAAFVLTAAMLANGIVVATPNHASTDTITMPAKAVIAGLFGANKAIGDSFVWYVINIATTVNHNSVVTGTADCSLFGSGAVAANAADNETATAGGSSSAMFMTRLTNVDGSCVTYRLS